MNTNVVAARKGINWRKLFGEFGESLVCRWLRLQGWEILERNWRTGRSPEIDIVARRCDGVLAVIEVKTRSASTLTRLDNISSAIESVNSRKRQRLMQQARRYAQFSKLSVRRVDLVVVAVSSSTLRQLRARLEHEKEKQEEIFFRNHLKLDDYIRALIDEFAQKVPFEQPEGRKQIEIIHLEDVLGQF
jgi:putative endonuclease